jgi:hypothetical protein
VLTVFWFCVGYGYANHAYLARIAPPRGPRDVAASREITIQQLLKNALADEVARHHRTAKSPVRADERLIAMLRAKCATDFAFAETWFDLINRLLNKGIMLREAGGGLALYSAPSGARLCKASDMGYSLNTLGRRFAAPYPGDKVGLQLFRSSTTQSDEIAVIDEIPIC